MVINYIVNYSLFTTVIIILIIITMGSLLRAPLRQTESDMLYDLACLAWKWIEGFTLDEAAIRVIKSKYYYSVLCWVIKENESYAN